MRRILAVFAARCLLILIAGIGSCAAQQAQAQSARDQADTGQRSSLTDLVQLFQDSNRYDLEKRTAVAQQSHGFANEIQPLLVQKCIACHACYDAPCQLKMESAAGLERGGSKLRVYKGGRLQDAAPTRLGIDAHTTDGWRQRGFYGVLGGALPGEPALPALMQSMLDLGQRNPVPANAPIPAQVTLGLERETSCAAPEEFDRYAERQPYGGMPLAIAGLSADEYAVLSTWLAEGAVTEDTPTDLTPAEQSLVQAWETWLNAPGATAQLRARYLYEHLFLAHLYLEKQENAQQQRFFQLYRSYTKAPLAIQPVATVRPNDPVDRPFYYRLQPLRETVVHKTHITYSFEAGRLRQLQQLFTSEPWQAAGAADYSAASRANPFLTFAAIPAPVRYRFLLNDAGFFVRNFIRGPVCRGQIATDVIHDQFWVMFESPAHERFSNDPTYAARVAPLLGVPGQKTSLLDLGPEWLDYRGDRNNYLRKRERAYREAFPGGAQLAHIWNGDGDNDNAFLSIFRHHNSASIERGWHGEQPNTAWLMDYPLLERTYYELVVGFNVFGSVSHQAQTRLYFDLIRNEGETNFLRLLPPQEREAIYREWYSDSGRLKTLISYHPLDVKTPTAVAYTRRDVKADLLEQLYQRHPALAGNSDFINRRSGQRLPAALPAAHERSWRALHQLAARPARQLPSILFMPEVTFLRVDHKDGDQEVFTLLRNRRHSNVAFILGESLRYTEKRDSLTILPQLVGSYPNLMLRVDADEIDQFAAALAAVDSEQAMLDLVARWGLRRMNPEIWPVFHRFTELLARDEPLEAGVYDLNRYGRW